MAKYYKIEDSDFFEMHFIFLFYFKILIFSIIYTMTTEEIYFLVMKFIRL